MVCARATLSLTQSELESLLRLYNHQDEFQEKAAFPVCCQSLRETLGVSRTPQALEFQDCSRRGGLLPLRSSAVRSRLAQGGTERARARVRTVPSPSSPRREGAEPQPCFPAPRSSWREEGCPPGETGGSRALSQRTWAAGMQVVPFFGMRGVAAGELRACLVCFHVGTGQQIWCDSLRRAMPCKIEKTTPNQQL